MTTRGGPTLSLPTLNSTKQDSIHPQGKFQKIVSFEEGKLDDDIYFLPNQ